MQNKFYFTTTNRNKKKINPTPLELVFYCEVLFRIFKKFLLYSTNFCFSF